MRWNYSSDKGTMGIRLPQSLQQGYSTSPVQHEAELYTSLLQADADLNLGPSPELCRHEPLEYKLRLARHCSFSNLFFFFISKIRRLFSLYMVVIGVTLWRQNRETVFEKKCFFYQQFSWDHCSLMRDDWTKCYGDEREFQRLWFLLK